MVPTADDVTSWVHRVTHDERNETGARFRSIRTGALFPAAAEAFRRHGFTAVDRLSLLERSLVDRSLRRNTLPRYTATGRLHTRDYHVAADIDADAFVGEWANDAKSLSDIADATPQHRSRIVADTSIPRSRWATPNLARAIGFAITGHAGHVGYLQRLAVRPSARRRGVGQYLVNDACRWLARRGSRTVMVNTGVDNDAALALYERCGFTRLTTELVVLELDLAG